MRESVCRGKYRIPFYLSDTCEKLLRKFLIRDPCKRGSLEMLIDDPWINEGYDSSPIQSDIGQSFAHDSSIVTLIEQRFKLDKATVMKSLTENAYDDIAAIYYLLHFEKETRGKIEDEVNSAQLLLASPTTVVIPELDSTDSSDPTFPVTLKTGVKPSTSPNSTTAVKGNSKNQDQTKSATLKKVDEDGTVQEEEVAELPSSSIRPKVDTRQKAKRRVTVGGEAEFAKLELEEEQNNLLKKNQAAAEARNATPTVVTKDFSEDTTLNTNRNHSQSSPPKQMSPPTKPAPVFEQNSSGSTSQNQQQAVPTIEVENSEKAVSATTAQPSAGEEGQQVQQQRKRHNTIVGILRSTIRRPSESGQPPLVSPSADKGPADFPQAPNSSLPAEDNGSTDSTDKPGEPRSLRFTFNSNSTSSKPPDEIVAEVVQACKKHFVIHKIASKYLVECNLAGMNGENIKFDIEICKLPRLKNLHGLRFKRLSGASAEYKDICEKILSTVEL
ncbi:Map microtubule affinity-regulating kinase [Clydaea vesicula]|uniref:non-specific serine/threonine protein kinase n=1 Tax=Clydaea vesicula TaxID=447962 RepID=A0AAD5TTK8_9FUNG|nr:Map microtubule affinity-regulating kinase [Clydaea vesicula]KAJ3376558.1 Map microtubule affinity-regulating kinase [Lobulomyces angularis]